MPSYPQSRADEPRTEIFIDGNRTDITNFVRSPDGTNAITITRGRTDAQSRISAQTSAFVLDNRDGRFSNRNPSSPYYGKLRNVQIRHKAGGVQDKCYLWCPYNDQSAFDEARTADKAVLDITGDLEVRLDIWPHTWRPDENGTGVRVMVLASKYAIAGDQRSWYLAVHSSGALRFGWSPDGTVGSRITVLSTATIPAITGRLSVKVTLDVNNGAGGNDVKFWTASSIDGTYTQLGATVTTAGVTSVFSSTAALVVGCGADNASIFDQNGLTYGGKVYEFRLYNGIGGTLVANPKFWTVLDRVISFSDGLGTPNTWAINGAARMTSDRFRFYGELSSIAQGWDLSHTDIYASAQASGMLQRLDNPSAPLRSPMFRQFSQFASLTGYWPMEDGNNAVSVANALTGGRPGQTLAVTLGNTSTLPGSASVAQFTSNTSFLYFSVNSANSGTKASFLVYLKLSAIPAVKTTWLSIYTTGTARRIDISLVTGSWNFDFYDNAGNLLSNNATAITNIDPTDGWVGFNLLLETSGGNVNWSARWLRIGNSSPFLGIGPFSYAGTVGGVSIVRIGANGQAAYADAQFAHLLIANTDIGFVDDNIANAGNAYRGETAAARINRLCSEEGVVVEITGIWANSARVGYQTIDTLLNLLTLCADTDLGMLGEARDQLALTYRTREDLQTRRDVDLSYTGSHLSAVPTPTDDSQGVANDITVTRTDGGLIGARRVITSGQLGTLAAGAFPRSWSTNAYTDDQMDDIAGVLAGQGTWDESRIPNLTAALHRLEISDESDLFLRIMSLNPGDTAALTGLPSPMPPDDTLLLVQGYTEVMSQLLWTLTYNVTPAKPLQVGTYDTTGTGGLARYDTGGSTLNTTITTTGTTVILNSTDAGDTWTVDGTSYPFDVMMEGERIRLNSAPGGSTSPQTFTGVTRSINGVVKAHSAGAAVSLAEPFFWG